MGFPDAAPGEDERPHDVLAADEFAMPAPDPDLHHHDPVRLPEDPSWIEEPHDVLAAEAFAMPAPRQSGPAALVERRGGAGRAAAEALAVLLALALLRRWRR
jgi:hypothetical protein